ncbi:hypothetical protein MAP00_000543 [Monascus purpureus]|nr:hypothetical protein MAP00_000543 [Monascus purpureus]
MPAVLQSTINLLETELAKARAALQEIQPHTGPSMMLGDEVTVGAMAAYRRNLIGRAPDFYYGSHRLTHKDLGLTSPVGDASPHDTHAWFNSPQCTLPRRTNLLDIFSNSLILDHMAPYLSTSSLLALASTSRFLYFMIMKTPYVFRHLDLSRCRGAQVPTGPGGYGFDNVQLDDSLTEDEFYSAHLKAVFASLERRSILQDVRTLILDGLSVPADLVSEIVLTDRFNVNILSIRECQHLNERKLMQVLQHAVRPTRPEGMPRVKGIYLFTPKNSFPIPGLSRYRDWWSSRLESSRDAGRMLPSSIFEELSTSPSQLQQHEWYRPSGRLLKRTFEDGWAQTLQKCQGIISFDAVLCRGPRHNMNFFSSENEDGSRPEGRFLGPAIATVALGPRGCDGCHSSPEGPAIWGQSADDHFPLLTPLPLHSSTIATAKCPALFPDECPVLIARCTECLTDRWCHRCNKWFCSSCLPHPERIRPSLSPHQTAVRAAPSSRNGDAGSSQERKTLGFGVSKDCWECGPTCATCKFDCQRICHGCQGDYCIEHNDGCSATMCDWCNTSSRRRTREL